MLEQKHSPGAVAKKPISLPRKTNAVFRQQESGGPVPTRIVRYIQQVALCARNPDIEKALLLCEVIGRFRMPGGNRALVDVAKLARPTKD
jgi:hypothetical protein